MLKITPTDTTKENEGAWTEYMGVQLKIARAQNPNFVAAIKKHTGLSKDKKDIDEEKLEEAMYLSMSEAVLMDWDNFVIDGKEVKYSQENAYELLKGDRDCREFVSSFSQEMQNFLDESRNSTVKK